MAGVCTLHIRIFAELIDRCRRHRTAQSEGGGASWTSGLNCAPVTGNGNLSRKHKAKARVERNRLCPADIFLNRLTLSAVFQGIQSDTTGSDDAFRCLPSRCDSRHSGLRCCYRCHVSVVCRVQIRQDSDGLTHDCTGRTGEGLPRRCVVLHGGDSRVALPDRSHGRGRCHDCRHSGLMRTKNSPFRTSMYNVNTSKIERGNTH